MSFKVINVGGIPGFPFAEGEAVIRHAGGDYIDTPCRTEEEIPAAAADADGMIGAFASGLLSLSGETMRKLPKCKIVAIPAMGYDGVDLEGATENGIIVVNNPDYGAEEVANHTMLLLLALARKLVPTVDGMRAGKWDSPGVSTIRRQVLPPLFRLSRQTLGLIGFGNVPRKVVPRAKPFFARILAYDAYVPGDVIRQFGAEPADLSSVLRDSDFISLHAALTKENHHMIGLEQFKMMKPTAYFVNTARGGLVNEEGLHTALSEGIVAGAALDVMDPEPPHPDNPLLKLPDIIITAHCAQYSQEADIQIRTNPCEDIVRVMEGGWPREAEFRNPQVKQRFQEKWSNK